MRAAVFVPFCQQQKTNKIQKSAVVTVTVSGLEKAKEERWTTCINNNLGFRPFESKPIHDNIDRL